MNFWTDVTSDMWWDSLLKEGVAQAAPNRTRCRNLFERVKAGDLMLHHLTTTLACEREKKSSVVGASEVASALRLVNLKIAGVKKHRHRVQILRENGAEALETP